MLSVLHVMSRMLPSGTELQLAGMLRAARGRQWEPTLCVLYPGFGLAASLADDGIEVVELDSGNRLHLDRMRALRRRTRGGGFDVVHTSLWGAGAFGRASVIGPRRPAVVMSERRVEDFRPHRLRLLDRSLAPVTDEWIGNSRDVCDFIVRAHGAPRARVHLVRNGIDTEVFRPAVFRPDETRAPSPVTPGSPGNRPARIGALGRLVHQKGFDVLLDALPLVLGKRPAELVIAGEGELREDLERRSHGMPVSLPGNIDGPPAVAEFLRGLDLFVMPSRYEGMPNAVLEALACGVPVVATDSPGMSEATGDAARLVPPEDPQRLADAIVAALDDTVAPPDRPVQPMRSFDDVALDHLQVFEAAVARRSDRKRS